MCLSGPSGVGKSTVCQRLVQRLDAMLSVSATTRPPRPGEVHGRDYWFLEGADFEARIAAGRLLEYARVYAGQYYGTPAEPVAEALGAGRTVILEIDIAGTLQVARRYPDAVTIYLLAPTAGDQQQRLAGRKQDTAEAMAERLAKADGEIRKAKECGAYKHFVVNADLDDTIDRLVAIIRAAASEHKENSGV